LNKEAEREVLKWAEDQDLEKVGKFGGEEKEKNRKKDRKLMAKDRLAENI